MPLSKQEAIDIERRFSTLEANFVNLKERHDKLANLFIRGIQSFGVGIAAGLALNLLKFSAG